MTRRTRIPAILAAVAVCLPVAGCGDDDVGDNIPQAKAQRLITELDVARQHVADQLCDEAATAVRQARATVDTLDDDGVGADVQDALGDGVDNLADLVNQACRGEEETTVPETTPTETIPTETTPTETTPTETTPTETVPSPTEPEPLPKEEPDEGDGGTQFDPNADLPPGPQKKAKKEKD